MHCLMLTRDGRKEGINTEYMNRARACLDSLGITYSRSTVEVINAKSAAAKAALSTEYDFALYPDHGYSNAYKTFVDSVDITLPMFSLAVSSAMQGSFIATNGAGISGTSATSSKFCTTDWSADEFQAVNAAWFTGVIGTGVALMTQTAAYPISPFTAQNEGYVTAWRFTRDSGSYMYCSGVFGEIPMLHYLLQRAINDGVFTASQVATLRKSPVFFEVDHINQSPDENNIDAIAAMIPDGGMMWCGIYNDVDAVFGSMTDAMAAKLLEYQNNGKLKYCWHTHSGYSGYPWPTKGFFPYHDQGGTLAREGQIFASGASNDGTAGSVLEVTGETFKTKVAMVSSTSEPNGLVCKNTTLGTQTVVLVGSTETTLLLRDDIFTGPAQGYELCVPTKADQDAYYQADKATWESKGLTFHQPGHYDSGANSWNEDTAALFSAEVSRASSADNDVSKAGYGFVSIRYIANGAAGTGTASSRRIANRTAFRENYHHDIHMVRGMQLIPTFDMGFNTPNNTISLWEDLFKMQSYQLANAMSIYIHSDDFSGVQDPGVAALLHQWIARLLAERLADNNRTIEALLE